MEIAATIYTALFLGGFAVVAGLISVTVLKVYEELKCYFKGA